ncbi:MAG: hypothetical protein IJ770_01130 [Alphaproteobacteria bacterium]|nr:hypothetical protein [Alphaproteobacteria bacterium]
MVNIAPIIVAANTMTTLANTSRMRRNSGMYVRSPKQKPVKKKESPSFMKEKFEELWQEQENRLSSLEYHNVPAEHDSFSVPDYYESTSVWRYDNGKLAKKVYSSSDGDDQVTRYDDAENIIEDRDTRYVYYPNSQQKEFEYCDGIVKHFAQDGRDDTAEYIVAHKIEKIHQKLKSKGILSKDAEPSKPVTKLGKVLSTVAVMKLEKSHNK